MFKSATLVTLLTVAATVLAQDLKINTPSGVIACQPTKISWLGGIPPYYLDLLDGNNVGGGSIQQLQTNTTDTDYSWDVVIKPGTLLDLQIRDSTGTTAQTATFTVGQPPAGNSACLNVGSSTSGSASSGSTTAVGATTKSSSSAAATTTPSSSAASSPATTSSGTVVTTPSSVATSSAATSNTVTTPSSSNTPSSSTAPSNSASSPAASTSPNGALANAVSTTGLLGALVAVFFA